MKNYCKSLFDYCRRKSCEVRVGGRVIGGENPVAVQTMTNTNTLDTQACVEQIGRIVQKGGEIVRLTTQGTKEALNLANIAEQTRKLYPHVALVADVHFVAEVAWVAADSADKVRINPGNYNDKHNDFERLIAKCKERGVALRIGVNHGSLSAIIVDEYGDTPEGMVASAMEFLRVCKTQNFDQVVVSLKSSNVRVMVYAYRLIVAAMNEEDMDYPIHLGVTEAGNSIEGRVKSAVGIGALLADGIGDTLRVSLTEAPENEIPVGQMLADYYNNRKSATEYAVNDGDVLFLPYSYSRRKSVAVGRVGGSGVPLLWSEMTDEERSNVAVVEAVNENKVQEWRSKIGKIAAEKPVVLRAEYHVSSLEELQIKASADFGVMFIDALADGIDIVCSSVNQEDIDALSLEILQASRMRISKTEYIACPGCGRTLFDLQGTLDKIKLLTNHLVGLKIGVMGCIVNGLGEMSDADYGYIGAAPNKISLYRGKELVQKNIPQEEAIDALIDLLKSDGKWQEPSK